MDLGGGVDQDDVVRWIWSGGSGGCHVIDWGGGSGGCHVMDLGWVRRMSCDGFGGGVSGGCHVMDWKWRQKTLTGFRLRMLQGKRQWQFLLDLLDMFRSQIWSLYILSLFIALQHAAVLSISMQHMIFVPLSSASSWRGMGNIVLLHNG